MILGLVEPTSGRLLFKGRDVTHLAARERHGWFMKQVQPVFQDPFSAFSPLKKVESYLYETAHNYHISTRQNADQHVDNAPGDGGLVPARSKGVFRTSFREGKCSVWLLPGR